MKVKSKFVCQNCGYSTPRWMGFCPDCGEYNTFVEEVEQTTKKNSKTKKVTVKTQKLSEIQNVSLKRSKTGSEEFDRVLGGGIVPGALILLGGDPGIGKSTLLLQTAENIAKSGKKVLYVSGEESVEQLKIRANRMNVTSEKIDFLSETNIDSIQLLAQNEKPDILIIDSIQTMYSPEISSTPGSVSQVRESTNALMSLAKQDNISILLVGHVTKEGNLAGPRILEHMVDTVLYFEGEKYHSYRILRATKNRFGATNEVGMFEMSDDGLNQVTNPSEAMLASRPEKTSGSVVIPSIEGTRPLLLELQGLVSETSYPSARRMAIGYDLNRMILLIAILEKRLGISLKEMDCYSNIVGGLKSFEPALDLAVVFVLYSSFCDIEIPPDMIVFGEVGLTGEVRQVQDAEKRIKEAYKLGFRKCVLPIGNMKQLSKNKPDMEYFPVDNISQALNILKLKNN